MYTLAESACYRSACCCSIKERIAFFTDLYQGSKGGNLPSEACLPHFYIRHLRGNGSSILCYCYQKSYSELSGRCLS